MAGRCMHEGAQARVVMENVSLTKCREMGVVVSPHRHVDATGMSVDRCKQVISVDPIGQQSVFADCVVSQCQAPVSLRCKVSAEGGWEEMCESISGIRVGVAMFPRLPGISSALP